MSFDDETKFEEALAELLPRFGWEEEVLHRSTEEELIANWAGILFENNRGIDRLNDTPLTEGEMRQIIEQIIALRTPLKLNGFINGHSVTITRDNPADTLHFGKEVSLKIYDRREIATGQSRYQIVRQPQFRTASRMTSDRRGDVLLLINGMPVIHIELKRSGVPVSQACHQIEKYMAEGVYTGLFSLVQIFVAMNPEETLYFANPGPDGQFNRDFFFHWADFNNEPINDWKRLVEHLLSIPMAHQLIGFYTVADNTDGILKVMRSYQYYAANAISDKVARTQWEKDDQLGGFVWHTTGSGKTMTSFKSAQLIASSRDADKVIFMMDRIELGTQSLQEYRGFAEESEEVQATENTGVLVTKMKSDNPSDTLIVTSIQKMNNIHREADGLKEADLRRMNTKRVVFIVDECHRSTFGDMLVNIKRTFPRAVFFGFTGTPIQQENRKKENTTTTLFGNELHRYSIADGIRDKNVLGFDPYKVLTYKDADLKRAVALEKAKARTVAEANADPQKSKVFHRYMNLPMAGHWDAAGKYRKGIEDYLPNSQYERDAHRKAVVQDILENFETLSHGGKFHAIFATSSIMEAIAYYKLMKETAPVLKVSALFDPNIDNRGNGVFKESALVEMISDYNARYGMNFTVPTFARMKKDIAARLAHKKPYERIAQEPDQQLDLLIVVDQMLTGYDSKWVNTLYMDKVREYEQIIQAFSRTNRLFGEEKPFGVIRYYRRPHTMERNVNMAVSLYSGNKPLSLFVDKLPANLKAINRLFLEIRDLFENAGIPDFSRLPQDGGELKEFARLFRELQDKLEAARLQGFRWNKQEYSFRDSETGKAYTIAVALDEVTFHILTLRYNEMFVGGTPPPGGGSVPYNVDGYPVAIATGAIDDDFMNSRFEKFKKLLQQEGASADALKRAEEELHKTFATLTQEQQKYANIFLHDILSGDAVPEDGKTFRDYVNAYMSRAHNDRILRFAATFGLDEAKLRRIMSLPNTEGNINEFGRLDDLKSTVDKAKAKQYFEEQLQTPIPPHKVAIKIDQILRKFILEGGFEV